MSSNKPAKRELTPEERKRERAAKRVDHLASLQDFDLRPDSAILRPAPTAAHLGVSIGTVWRLVRAGELTAVKLSPRVTGIPVGSVRAYLARLNGKAA